MVSRATAYRYFPGIEALLVEAALKPAAGRMRPADRKLLTRALALAVGTEAVVVLKDVLQLDEAEGRRVRRWAIRALVAAALDRKGED